jgi:hypothetical protein
MSLQIGFWFVDDSEIELFRARPALFETLLQSLARAGSGVQHQNVKAAHYILNGTKRPVEGAGRLFQTWFDPFACDDLCIRHLKPAFVFTSAQVGELTTILDALTEEVIERRTRELASPDADDPSFWIETFDDLRSMCDEALATKQGLLWTAR